MKPKSAPREVEKFFDAWNPKMAYVLGYFAADGCMYVNKNGGKYISFTSSDLSLILLVKNLTQASNAIEIYQPKGNTKLRYTIQIGSVKLFNCLLDLGFTPNKSLTLKFPNSLPTQLIGHFLRGYFDGDGCAVFCYYKRNNRPNPTRIISIRLRCGSQEFIQQLRKTLKNVACVGNGTLYFHSRAYELVYSAKDVVKLFKFMYPERNVPRLNRKYIILQKGLESLGP